jgi:hypothetical protein
MKDLCIVALSIDGDLLKIKVQCEEETKDSLKKAAILSGETLTDILLTSWDLIEDPTQRAAQKELLAEFKRQSKLGDGALPKLVVKK